MNVKEWIIKTIKEDKKLNSGELILALEKSIPVDFLVEKTVSELRLIDHSSKKQDNEDDYDEDYNEYYEFEVLYPNEKETLVGYKFFFDPFTDGEDYFPKLDMYKVEYIKSFEFKNLESFEKEAEKITKELNRIDKEKEILKLERELKEKSNFLNNKIKRLKEELI